MENIKKEYDRMSKKEIATIVKSVFNDTKIKPRDRKIVMFCWQDGMEVFDKAMKEEVKRLQTEFGFDKDNPNTYPTESGFYACTYTNSNFIGENFWNNKTKGFGGSFKDSIKTYRKL